MGWMVHQLSTSSPIELDLQFLCQLAQLHSALAAHVNTYWETLVPQCSCTMCLAAKNVVGVGNASRSRSILDCWWYYKVVQGASSQILTFHSYNSAWERAWSIILMSGCNVHMHSCSVHKCNHSVQVNCACTIECSWPSIHTLGNLGSSYLYRVQESNILLWSMSYWRKLLYSHSTSEHFIGDLLHTLLFT